jgi:hypothetical protein
MKNQNCQFGITNYEWLACFRRAKGRKGERRPQESLRGGRPPRPANRPRTQSPLSLLLLSAEGRWAPLAELVIRNSESRISCPPRTSLTRPWATKGFVGGAATPIDGGSRCNQRLQREYRRHLACGTNRNGLRPARLRRATGHRLEACGTSRATFSAREGRFPAHAADYIERVEISKNIQDSLWQIFELPRRR